MLVYWIPEGAHTLPVNATHQVGIGALVLNENEEVHFHALYYCSVPRKEA